MRKSKGRGVGVGQTREHLGMNRRSCPGGLSPAPAPPQPGREGPAGGAAARPPFPALPPIPGTYRSRPAPPREVTPSGWAGTRCPVGKGTSRAGKGEPKGEERSRHCLGPRARGRGRKAPVGPFPHSMGSQSPCHGLALKRVSFLSWFRNSHSESVHGALLVVPLRFIHKEGRRNA